MKIVFATNNEHKLSEIRGILGDKVEVLSLKDIGCNVDIPETGETLEENALQKARYVYDNYHMDVFSDDTGLEVDALGGQPGVHTARYAGGEGHDSEANTRKLLRVLSDEDNRKARFRTVIALITQNPKPDTHLFEGIVEGEITREKRGEKGFGYDPVFKPDGYEGTFAELGVDVKNQISHRARAVQKLVKYLSGLLLFYLFTFLPLNVNGQIGTWRNYMAYHDVQNISSTGNVLFVQASNGLYSYNLSDQSITTFDKVNGLSDTYITHTKWNPTVKRLIIIYQNQNIDLMEESGEVINLSDLYQKSMTANKTVNSIYIKDQYAYLACGFGVVKVDMDRIEVSESYNLNDNISQVAVSGDAIFAKQSDGRVLTCALSSNLLDPNNWILTTQYDASIFNEDRTDYNQYLETVQTLNPGGPKYNYFGYLKHQYGKLYTCSGNNSNPGCIQVKDGDEWIIFQDTDLNAITGLNTYKSVSQLGVDPNNPYHVFAGARNGLYEFLDGKLIKHYQHTNSPIEMFDGKSPEYQLIYGVYCDYNYVWCLNSQAPTKSLLRMKMDTNEWESFDFKSIMIFKDGTYNDKSLPYLVNMMSDSRGYTWFANDFWDYQSIHYFYFDNSGSLHTKSFFDFINQNGVTVTINGGVTQVVEDYNNDLWITTSEGPLLLKKDQIESDNPIFTQVIIPRNDGTKFGDYLLSGIETTCLDIDKDNRKWFGTKGSGVFVISNDNMVQIHNFTTTNSPLLSDNIESISIDNETGEVFIATDKGLCSYMSGVDSSITEMTEDEVYAYPNPVTSDYNGLITITGLSNDANVKIMTTNGTVVAEGKSNGRFFTWNGRDKNGNRVASGIYMVATATSKGEKGVVCKIAIIN